MPTSEDARFPAYEAFVDGLLIANGPTPVPDDVRAIAHEIRWIPAADPSPTTEGEAV